MLPYPIAPSQTDCKSPIDDVLMDSIRLNLDYLDGAISGSTAKYIQWKINGKLRPLVSFKGAIDSGAVGESFTPQGCKASIKHSGTSGKIIFDVMKNRKVSIPITGINAKSLFDTQSIARINIPASTQSISLSTATINTQSITYAKAALNIQSIIHVSGNLWRLNLDVAPDADYLVDDYIVVAGTSDANNQGTFQIAEVNQSDFPSLVIINANGVQETTPSGTAQLKLMSYNFANPVHSTYFKAGLKVIFASHTTPANNGTFDIRKINQSGNNIFVMIQNGATQAGVAGTSQTCCWSYNMSSSVDVNYVAGEKANASSHTTPANNGTFDIISINDGGNNISLHNPLGVAQGGVAGTINCNRWIYTALAPQVSLVTVGDRFKFSNHTNPLNDGVFEILAVDLGGGVNYNVVIHNPLGVAQAAAVGKSRSELCLVKFGSNQSSIFDVTESYIEILGAQSSYFNRARNKYFYKVQDQNFGGGSNYNVVIKEIDGVEQLAPMGFVTLEARSVFNNPQEFSAETSGQFIGDSWLIQDFSSDVKNQIIASSEVLSLHFLDVQYGNAEDFNLTLM